MATERLRDERLRELMQEVVGGLGGPEIVMALAELQRHRAGEIAPEGFVLVGEADLRALIADCGRSTTFAERNAARARWRERFDLSEDCSPGPVLWKTDAGPPSDDDVRACLTEIVRPGPDVRTVDADVAAHCILQGWCREDEPGVVGTPLRITGRGREELASIQDEQDGDYMADDAPEEVPDRG